MQSLHPDCLQFNIETTITLGLYRHYKGAIYEVIGVAHHTETLEDVVVYRAVKQPAQIWVRPTRMWFEEVVLEGGRNVIRFEWMGSQ